MGVPRAIVAAVLATATGLLPVSAEEALLCFGNEPSWSVDLTAQGTARLAVLNGEPVVYRGSATPIEPLDEEIWRGRPTGDGGELVVFLRRSPCSDGMSDVTHPVTARVSLPDGKALAGCCRDPSTRTEAAAPANRLEGVHRTLTSMTTLDAARLAAAPRPATLRLDAGRLTAFAGCNQLAGGYTIEGDRLTVRQLAGTLMACAEPAMKLERALKDALSGDHRFRLEGRRLTLVSSAGGTLVFEEERLEGVEWEVVGWSGGRGAIVSPMEGTTLHLRFQDGTVAGSAGCNTFSARYSVDGEAIAVESPATTRKSCATDVMYREGQFLAAFESAKSWRLRGDTLDLVLADGTKAVTARKRAP